MQITLLRPQGLIHSPAFSHVAVVPAGAITIYVGGQNAVDADGVLVGEADAVAQAEYAMQNVKTALAAAGAGVADVVQWTVLLVEGTDVGAVYGAIAADVASEEPGLVTAALVSALGLPGALVEIAAIAALVQEEGSDR
ncbi:MAG: Rid family hydrolase [Micropruina sp.]|uniref:RidA family protein n=1 Tax=Micropruina sp. TaxID=2737536 RepID=UPI0039E70FCE